MIHGTTSTPAYSVQYACIYAPRWIDVDGPAASFVSAAALAQRTRAANGRTCRVIEETTGRPVKLYVGHHAPGLDLAR